MLKHFRLSILNCYEEVVKLFHNLNTHHTNTTFTKETEKIDKLAFLDVLISKTKRSTCMMTVFHKKTYTVLLMNFLRFTPFSYKIGLVKTLIDRTFRINTTTKGLNADVREVVATLISWWQCNFPSFPINKIKNMYLDKTNQDQTSKNNSSQIPKNASTKYYKLPYVSNYSTITEKKILQIIKHYYINIDVKLIFITCKIDNFFIKKDRIQPLLKSCVIQ